MDTPQIVVLIVVVVIALAAVGALLVVGRRKRRERHHVQAEQMRAGAEHAAGAIPEAQVRAREADAEADRARLEAERAEGQAARANQALEGERAEYEDQIRRADRLDPQVNTKSDSYRPDVAVAEPEQPAYDPRGRVHATDTAPAPPGAHAADRRPGPAEESVDHPREGPRPLSDRPEGPSES